MAASTKDNIPGDSAADLAKLCRLATSLLNRSSALQSGNTRGPITDEVLRAGLEAHVALEQGRRVAAGDRAAIPIEPAYIVGEILTTARNALNRFNSGTSASMLSEHERDALQAVVEVTGRPALRYLNGHVQPPASDVSENEHWITLVSYHRSTVETVSRSVGRVVIERPGMAPEILGTAWRLGEELLVTNRHVARRLAAPGEDDPSRWQLDSSRVVAIDFAAMEGEIRPARFPITALEYCAPEQYVDLAVLRLRDQGATTPPALTLDDDPGALGFVASEGGAPSTGAQVYVIGHPVQETPTNEIRRVFGTADGTKRLSPGCVTSVRSDAALLEHDCSTLGGNSGSCVVTWRSHRVVGLHFGGRDVDETSGVGKANLAVALTRLGAHPALQVLRTGRIKGS